LLPLTLKWAFEPGGKHQRHLGCLNADLFGLQLGQRKWELNVKTTQGGRDCKCTQGLSGI